MKMSEVHKASGKLPPDWSECDLMVKQKGDKTFLGAHKDGKHKTYNPEKEIWEDLCE